MLRCDNGAFFFGIYAIKCKFALTNKQTEMQSLIRIVYHATRIAPVVLGNVLQVHCILLLKGVDSGIIRHFCAIGWLTFAMLMLLSFMFRFCYVHRLYIIYCTLLNICIQIQQQDGFAAFGINVDIVREIMLYLGAVLQILLIYRVYGKRAKNTCRKHCESAEACLCRAYRG